MSETKRPGGIAVVIMAAIVLTPRIARMLYPAVNVEDSAYLDIIASLSRGLRPHTDFVHTHFVFPEILVSLIKLAVGSTIRAAEIGSAIAVTTTAYLVYKIEEKLSSSRAGIIAALVFALHPIFITYHVFEKEIYEILISSLIVYLLLKDDDRKITRLVTIASLLTLGFACKLDFAAFAGFICLYVLIVERRVKHAFLLGALFTIGVSLLIYIVYSNFGEEAMKQIFLFHFFKGAESGAGGKLFKIAIAAGPILVSAAGALVTAREHDRKKLSLMLFWLAGPALFFLVVTDAFWAHNIITFIPALSILTGVFISDTIKMFFDKSSASDEKPITKTTTVLLLFVTIVFLVPYLRFVSKYNFGFNGLPRQSIEVVADKLASVSGVSDIVIAPAFISGEASRTDIVHNREVFPVYVWAMNEIGQKGFSAARREAMKYQFRELYRMTEKYWLDQAWWMIESGRIKAVVGYRGKDYQPFDPDPARMMAAGFEEIYSDRDYTIWALKR